MESSTEVAQIEINGHAYLLRADIPVRVFLNFISHVEFKPNGCWEWVGAKRKSGQPYGSFCYRGRNIPAHRFSYEALRGPIPPYRHLHHKTEKPVRCMGGACINPDHVEPLTQEEHNTRHGRDSVGLPLRRTFCELGHTLTPYRDPVGVISYRCKICRAESKRKKYLEWRDANPPATTCKNGHPKTAEFGYDNGRQWICRECQRAAMLAYKDRHAAELAAKKATSRGHQRDWEACAKGHPFTPENTYNAPNGTRMCRTCRADRQRAHWHKKHPDAPFQPQKGKHSNPADSPVQ